MHRIASRESQMMWTMCMNPFTVGALMATWPIDHCIDQPSQTGSHSKTTSDKVQTILVNGIPIVTDVSKLRLVGADHPDKPKRVYNKRPRIRRSTNDSPAGSVASPYEHPMTPSPPMPYPGYSAKPPILPPPPGYPYPPLPRLAYPPPPPFKQQRP
jgi:hypothetical protein